MDVLVIFFVSVKDCFLLMFVLNDVMGSNDFRYNISIRIVIVMNDLYVDFIFSVFDLIIF